MKKAKTIKPTIYAIKKIQPNTKEIIVSFGTVKNIRHIVNNINTNIETKAKVSRILGYFLAK